jgi:hypothetical protein
MNHEGKSATETTAVEDVFLTDPISRRTLVKAGASAVGMAVLAVPPQPPADQARKPLGSSTSRGRNRHPSRFEW